RDIDVEAPPLLIAGHRLIEVGDVEAGDAVDGRQIGDGDSAAGEPGPTMLIGFLFPAVGDDAAELSLHDHVRQCDVHRSGEADTVRITALGVDVGGGGAVAVPI